MSVIVLSSRAQHRVLVVEDDYIVAENLRAELNAFGADVLGPVASLESALAVLATGLAPTAAILDVKLQGEWVFPLADALQKRGIPFVFATGYDSSTIPAAYGGMPYCEKPYNAERLLTLLFRQTALADVSSGTLIPGLSPLTLSPAGPPARETVLTSEDGVQAP